MKKLFITLILLLCFVNVKAYENDYFKIDIPDGFKEAETESGVYKWQLTNKNDDLIITVSKNNGDTKEDISTYTKENLTEYEKYLETNISSQLEDYNITVDVSNAKLTKVNDYDAIEYDTKWPTKESFGYDIYQKGYIFTTNNYIIGYTYTSDKELADNEYLKETLKSFQLLDSKVENNSFFSKRINRIIVVGAVAGILGFLISALTNKKKKKNNEI